MPAPDLVAAVQAWWAAEGLADSVGPLYPTRVDSGEASVYPRVVLTVGKTPTVRSSSSSKVFDSALKFRALARDEATAGAMVNALRPALDGATLTLASGIAVPLYPINWQTVPDTKPGPSGPIWTYDLDYSARVLIPNP